MNARSGRVERRADVTRSRAHVLPAPRSPRQVSGRGRAVGTAYRLADGRLVIVPPR